MHDKSLKEELNWVVDYGLGILDPFVEDPDQVLGGKRSRTNSFYPYANEYEMRLAFEYIFMTEDVTEAAWALWIATQLSLQKMLGGENEASAGKKLKLNEDGLRILEGKSYCRKTPDRDYRFDRLAATPSQVGMRSASTSLDSSCYCETGESTPVLR